LADLRVELTGDPLSVSAVNIREWRDHDRAIKISEKLGRDREGYGRGRQFGKG
jgi:hypothetical protein